MSQMTKAPRRRNRPGIQEYEFTLRADAVAQAFSPEVYALFNGDDPIRRTRRCSPAGFAEYREKLRHNGFLLEDVKPSRRGSAA